MIKYHLFCGDKYKPGWVNVDIRPLGDVCANLLDQNYWDKEIKDNSVDFFFQEHAIEHFSAKDGKWLLSQCYKKLKPGGVLRIATPDLAEVVHDCYTGQWRSAKWLTEVPQGKTITTMAEYLNIGMRDWDHKFLYDEETLKKYLIEVGFTYENIIRTEWGRGCYVETQNLETREDSKLILEAIK